MKKGIITHSLVLLALMSAWCPLYAQTVAREEVAAADAESITFINYEGPHTEIDTYIQIGEIGSSLGTAPANGTAGDRSRYYVIHAGDPAEKTGFSADIFILGKNAGVDHIRNLRHIIASYLSAAYGYSARDAETLARYITVYNAVYRSNMSYFEQRYQKAVVNHLTGDKAGLSTYWEDWADKTQILIPLTGEIFEGTISSVDTTAISDRNVVTSLQESDDKSIDDRKDMTDLKERESEAAEQKAVQAQKEAEQKDREIAQEEKRIAQEKEQLEQDKQEAARQKKEAEELERKADKTPEEEQELAEKKEAAAQAEAAAEQKESEIAEREAAVEEQKAESEQLKEEAAAAEEMAQTKEAEVRQDRQAIADDQKEIIAAENAESEAAAAAAGISGLRVINESQLLCDVVMIDTRTGQQMKTSALKSIRGRTLIEAGTGFIAIAGTKAEGAVRLVQIDSKTLDITAQGSDNIAEASLLLKSAGYYFAVLDTPDGYKLGKFDNSLKLLASSAVAVSPYTMITVSGADILVQDSAQNMILLNTEDLSAR